jgi:hypothetical protein
MREPPSSTVHPFVNSDRKRALVIVRQTVATANSNTGNLDFLSTLISKTARAGVAGLHEGSGLRSDLTKGFIACVACQSSPASRRSRRQRLHPSPYPVLVPSLRALELQLRFHSLSTCRRPCIRTAPSRLASPPNSTATAQIRNPRALIMSCLIDQAPLPSPRASDPANHLPHAEVFLVLYLANPAVARTRRSDLARKPSIPWPAKEQLPWWTKRGCG